MKIVSLRRFALAPRCGAMLLIGLALTTALTWGSLSYSVDAERSLFQERAYALGQELGRRIEYCNVLLGDAVQLFHASEEVTAAEFAEFFHDSLTGHTFIKGAAFLPLQSDGGWVQPADPARYRQAQSGDAVALFSAATLARPDVMAAVRSAATTGDNVVVSLSGAEGEPACYLFRAVYARRDQTVVRTEPVGMVALAVRPFGAAYHFSEAHLSRVRLYESSSVLIDTGAPEVVPTLQVTTFQHAQNFPIGGQNFLLGVERPIGLWDINLLPGLAALFAGLTLTGAAVALMRSSQQHSRLLSERHQAVEDEVMRQTRTLRLANVELEHIRRALDEHALVSISDVTGNISSVNDKFCAVSQYGREELIGRSHRLLKSDRHPDEFFRQMWAQISAGKVWRGEVANCRKDGTIFWVDATIVPFLDDSGAPFQYVAIETDITALKETAAR